MGEAVTRRLKVVKSVLWSNMSDYSLTNQNSYCLLFTEMSWGGAMGTDMRFICNFKCHSSLFLAMLWVNGFSAAFSRCVNDVSDTFTHLTYCWGGNYCRRIFWNKVQQIPEKPQAMVKRSPCSAWSDHLIIMEVHDRDALIFFAICVLFYSYLCNLICMNATKEWDHATKITKNVCSLIYFAVCLAFFLRDVFRRKPFRVHVSVCRFIRCVREMSCITLWCWCNAIMSR